MSDFTKNLQNFRKFRVVFKGVYEIAQKCTKVYQKSEKSVHLEIAPVGF